MNAPNRASEVAAVVDRNRHFLTGDDGRRELLIVICRELNKQDGGQWGRLVKHDQGDKIPADIIVWKETREHFDVLTDTGPMWAAKGVLVNERWEWQAVPESQIPPQPPPVDPPTPDDALEKRVGSLEAMVENLQAALVDDQLKIKALEDKPAPAFQLPALMVTGNTSRRLGHAHEIQLDVVVKP